MPTKGAVVVEASISVADQDKVARLERTLDLSLQQAAALYDVTPRALRRRVTLGEVAAHKAQGLRGREWRVSAAALQQAGYVPRTVDLAESEDTQSTVRRLTEALVAERSRSARLDGELGYALLTIGRLRRRLQDAGIDPDQLFGAELGHAAGDDSPPGSAVDEDSTDVDADGGEQD